MVFVSNAQFFLFFILGKTSQENVFQDILQRINAFLDYKSQKKVEKLGFFQSGQSVVLVKNSQISILLFQTEQAKKMCFTIFYKEKKPLSKTGTFAQAFNTLRYPVLPCVPLSYHVFSCRFPCVTPCYPVLPFITRALLCYPVLPFVTLCYALLSCISLCYSVFLCVTLCYSVTVTLCYSVFFTLFSPEFCIIQQLPPQMPLGTNGKPGAVVEIDGYQLPEVVEENIPFVFAGCTSGGRSLGFAGERYSPSTIPVCCSRCFKFVPLSHEILGLNYPEFLLGSFKNQGSMGIPATSN